jgi:DNA-binding CsgD family transcriptional regulator
MLPEGRGRKLAKGAGVSYTLGELLCGGRVWMQVIASVVGPLVQLSRRERQVLRLLACGETNKTIGYALGISLSTVKWNVTKMVRSLGLDNRVKLCLWAVAHPEAIDGVAVPAKLILPVFAAA